MLKHYWASLRLIGHDVSLLYRNFFHWNLAKLCILWTTLLIATGLSLPLILGAYFLLKDILGQLPTEAIDGLIFGGTVDQATVSLILSHTWAFVAVVCIGLIIFTLYTTCILSYGYFLSAKLYTSYIEGEKTLRNEYWNLRKIWKCTGVLGWSTLYMLSPFLGIAILFGGLFVLTQTGILTPNTNELHAQILAGIGLMGGLAFLIMLLVIAIRVLFGYMHMLDTDAESSSAHELVRRSLHLTKGGVLRIIALSLPFVILAAGTQIGIQMIQQKRDLVHLEQTINAAAKEKPESFVNDHTFVQREYIRSVVLWEEGVKDVLEIGNAYMPQTTHVDTEYLKEIYPYIIASGTLDSWEDRAWSIGGFILSFLLVEWLMTMVYLSIFQILKNTSVKTNPVNQNTVPSEAKKPTPKKAAPKKSTSKTPAKSEKAPAKKAPTKKKAPAKKPSRKTEKTV